MSTIHRLNLGGSGFGALLSLVVVGCGGLTASDPGKSGSPVAQQTGSAGASGSGGTAGQRAQGGASAAGGPSVKAPGGDHAAGSGGNAATGGQTASGGSSGSSGSASGGSAAGGNTSGGSAAGGKASGGSAGSSGKASGGSTSGGAAGQGAGGTKAYGGKGFVVHEWGTNTIVVGSDGSMQRGLHHEEEDLPGFVYDRLSAGAQLGSPSVLEVNGKMETPVTYFYSDIPRQVQASVDFPKGVFTQWYPAVTGFYPPIFDGYLGPDHPAGYGDPVFDPTVAFSSPSCQAQYTAVGNGMLDWGTFSVLGPGVDAPGPEAPLDKYTWSYARQVQSNTLLVPTPGATDGPQREKFLFYRGLGNLTLPALVQAGPGGALSLTDTDAVRPVGATYVINVGAEGGAFHAFPGGFGAGQPIADLAPSLDGAAGLDDYAAQLAASVTATLDATGLYHDEALAMVHTWSRQWFRTPGLRVLYLLPPSATDEQIPLTITPTPDATVRVMMIRVEVITPELEASDLAAIDLFGGSSAEGAEHFTALGRFAEPRLRRALALAAPSAARDQATLLLATLRTADTRSAAGE